MTGANFLTYLKRTFKRSDKDTELYEAITDCVLDMRLRFYADDFKARSSALTGCTSVGDYSLALPTDFGHLIGEVSFKDDGDEQDYPPLTKIGIEDYDRLYPGRMLDSADRDTGVPRHFCIFGGDLLVGPCVDQTDYKFYINYTQEDATDIVAGTTDVPFTDTYREVVKAGALMRAYRDLEMYGEADVQEGLYERGIAKIAANDDLNTSASGNIVYSGV